MKTGIPPRVARRELRKVRKDGGMAAQCLRAEEEKAMGKKGTEKKYTSPSRQIRANAHSDVNGGVNGLSQYFLPFR